MGQWGNETLVQAAESVKEAFSESLEDVYEDLGKHTAIDLEAKHTLILLIAIF